MQTFWTCAALAVGITWLLAMTRWVWSGADTQITEWLWSNRAETLGWVAQLAAGCAVAALLARGKPQRGTILGLVLAAGVATTALISMVASMALSDIELVALLLGFCLPLGLMVVLAAMRRWTLLWLGIAAFAGTLPEVLELVSAALSFMHQ